VTVRIVSLRRVVIPRDFRIVVAVGLIVSIAGCVRRVPAGQDANGTFDATTVERGDVVYLVERFFFPPGEAVIGADVEPAIARVAQQLNERRYRRRAVLVEGHSDGSGSDATNERLSVARAEAIAELLVQHGVDAARVHARGFGKTRPLAVEQRTGGQHSLEARARNRRVDVVLGDPPNH
jgi:outer membrane protein OmpA-like peptidoglycan-associated protein